MNILRIAAYIGIGVVLHLIFIGQTFDFTNAWTWVWLFVWPLGLFIAFWAVALVIFLIVALVAFSTESGK